MKKKLLLFITIMIVVLALQACGKDSKEVTTDPAQPKETEQKAENTEQEAQSFATYQELKEFGKQETTQFSQLLQKNNIDQVVTPDHMYATNKQKEYEKYTQNYIFDAAYLVRSDFINGNGAGVIHIVLEQHSDDPFTKEDQKIKFLADVVNEMTDNPITVDELVNQLTQAKGSANADPAKHATIKLGKENKGSIEIDLNTESKSIVTLQYAKNYNVFTLKKAEQIYNTVAEYKDEEKNEEKLKGILFKNGGNEDDPEYYSFNQGGTLRFAFNATNNSEDRFTEEMTFDLSTYDVKNEEDIANNIAVKSIYDVLKTTPGNESLSESDFIDFVRSAWMYAAYPITTEDYDDYDYGDILPISNLEIDEDGPSIDPFLEEDNTHFEFFIRLNIPVVAEGKTSI